MKHASPTRHVRRGAILTMELVLVLPIFLLLIFALVEFSLLMTARTRAGDAARAGARMLSLTGGSADEIRQTVAQVLGESLSRDCRIDVQTSPHAGGIGNVHVQLPMNNACPDLLWMTGFSVRNRYIHADAPMVMERPSGGRTSDLPAALSGHQEMM